MVPRAVVHSLVIFFCFQYFPSGAHVEAPEDPYDEECAEIIKPTWTVKKLDNVTFDEWPRWYCLFWRYKSDQLDELVTYIVTRRNISETEALLGMLAQSVYYGQTVPMLHVLYTRHLLPRLTLEDKLYCLKKTIMGGQYWMLRNLLERRGFSVYREDNVLLLTAARSGNLDILKYLVETVGIRVKQGDVMLLMKACQGANIDLMKYLIYEKDLIGNGTRNEFGGYTASPLYYAILSGKLEPVRFLIETLGYDPDEKYDNGQTASRLAIEAGSLPILKYLLEEKKVDLHTLNKFRGFSLLHTAARNGQLEALKYLIDKYHEDPHQEDNWGRTPIQFACVAGYLNVVKYLVEEQKANLSYEDIHGRNLLHWATYKGHLDVVKYLADRMNSSHYFQAWDLTGNTVVTTAVAPVDLNVADPFFRLPILKYFLDEKHINVGLSSCDENGNKESLMQLAVKSKDFMTVKYLFEEKGYDIDLNSYRRLTDAYSTRDARREMCKTKRWNKYFDAEVLEGRIASRMECQRLGDEYCKNRLDRLYKTKLSDSINDQRCQQFDEGCTWWDGYQRLLTRSLPTL